jgi:putative transposase
MPRKPLIRSETLPYHVTSRSHNKVPFPIPLEAVWSISKECFEEANEIQPINLISFVLMDNHYHMIVQTPDGNLDKFMYEFNRRFAKKILDRSGGINQIFGGRYKWCLIESERYFSNCYRYVYQNPVRANIVNKCEDYLFSTLPVALGVKHFPISIHDKIVLEDKLILEWLNSYVGNEENSALKRSLTRSKLVSLKDSHQRLI